MMTFGYLAIAVGSLSEEDPWNRESNHESAGARAHYCNEDISFNLLPRGPAGELRWNISNIKKETTFRVIVSRPYVEGEPIFDRIIKTSSTGVQTHPVSLPANEEFRYTVQAICNEADPSHNVAASGFIRDNSLFGTNTSATNPNGI